MMQVKTRAEELTVLGGRSAYAELLHVGRPNIGDVEGVVSRVRGILERRWLTNDGPVVRELEDALARRLGVKHCIAVTNGTAGLELVIHALGLEGEVIVPSFTFVATAHAVRWLGHDPVFADVGLDDHVLDPGHVEALIGPRTSAILGVHLWGVPCRVEALTELARRKGVRLIFDAAHALGCSSGAVPIGNFGDAEVFSFHATKFFNSFEGGAITTNDDALADTCRRLRNFGFAGYDNVVSVGTNAKMTEVCAAMGLESLAAMDGFIAKNREHHANYGRLLEGVPGLSLLRYATANQSNYQYVVLSVDESSAGLTRDQLVAVLHAENVLARRYFAPGVHRMKAYAEEYGDVQLPNTDRLASSVLCLPTGTAIAAEDVAQICAVLRLAVENASRIRAAL